MQNALKRIEVCKNMAAMTQKLSEEIIYINESLFSELSKLRDIVKKYEEGRVNEEVIEQDVWQDTSDLKEVTEENQERVEKGDEEEIVHTMELQLILAKQQDLKELNTGNVDEVKYPSVDVRQKEDKDPSLTESQKCMMEIIEKELDAYKKSL